MKAMIFAAGLGTRFKPWTDHHPKALALVNGKSLLQRNIEYLQQYGIRDVVVNVHHFADQVISAIDDNEGWGSNVVISDETKALLETGGGLLKARHLLDDQPFISLNADFLTDLKLDLFLDFHKNQDSLITLAVTNRKSSRVFLSDSNGRLCGWRNRSTGEEIISVTAPLLLEKAYSCVAAFQPSFFDVCRQQGKFSITETYLDLAKDYKIMLFDHSGDKLVDVGKPDSVQIAESLFK
jgi:NDP-sugar pyrophosphorylase family protein